MFEFGKENKMSKVRIVKLLVAVFGLLIMCSSVAQARYLYVSSYATGKVYRFNEDGTPAPATGKAGAIFIEDADYAKSAYGVAVNGNYLYVSNNAVRDTRRYDLATGARDTSFKIAAWGYSLKVNNDTLYAAYMSPGRVFKFNTDAQTFVAATQLGADYNVFDMTFDNSGNAYVANSKTTVTPNETGIKVYNSSWANTATYTGISATGIAFNQADNYVYFSGGSKVGRMTTNGVVDTNWTGSTGTNVTRGLAIGSNGKVYTATGTSILCWDTTATGTLSPTTFATTDGNTTFLTWGPADANAPVPEPAGLITMAGGLASLAGLKLRRRK